MTVRVDPAWVQFIGKGLRKIFIFICWLKVKLKLKKSYAVADVSKKQTWTGNYIIKRQNSRSAKSAAKVVGATSSEGFLVSMHVQHMGQW